jgi:hypothetical protein
MVDYPIDIHSDIKRDRRLYNFSRRTFDSQPILIGYPQSGAGGLFDTDDV